MLWRPLAWALLLLHFFFPEPFREQILAVQTVFSASHRRFDAVHIATVFVTVFYFVKTEHHWHWLTFACHHAVVLGCTLSEYYFHEWRYWSWILLCWSVRWLASLDMYASPLHGAIRCAMFGIVSRGDMLMSRRRVTTFRDGFKWCWILMVHELAWVFLPAQMLYEVYKPTRRTESDDASPGVDSIV